MRENAIQESVANDFVSISYVEGKVNLADVFTKEDKDAKLFTTICDIIMGETPYAPTVSLLNNSVDKTGTDPKPSRTSTVALPEPSSGGCQLGGLGPSLQSSHNT